MLSSKIIYEFDNFNYNIIFSFLHLMISSVHLYDTDPSLFFYLHFRKLDSFLVSS
jgi:hypothetical protein